MLVLIRWFTLQQVGPFTRTVEHEQLCPLEHMYITPQGDLQLCAIWEGDKYLGGTIPVPPDQVISMAYYTTSV